MGKEGGGGGGGGEEGMRRGDCGERDEGRTVGKGMREGTVGKGMQGS